MPSFISLASPRALLAVALLPLLACQGDQSPASASQAGAGEPAPQQSAPERLAEVAAPAEPGDDAPLQAHVRMHGSVAGIDFLPHHGIALRGRVEFGARPEAVIFVASDVPNMCEHLQQGTLPSNSKMLAVALVQSNKRTPQAGDEFFPAGEQADEVLPMANGFFRQLDHACQIDARLLPHGGEALYGTATLGTLSSAGASVDLSFDMALGDDEIGHLEGTMRAPWCDAPLLFANAQQLFTGEVTPGSCR